MFRTTATAAVAALAISALVLGPPGCANVDELGRDFTGDGGQLGDDPSDGGPSWTSVEAPTHENLLAIHGTRISNVWAVGDQGGILHFDGLEWQIHHTPADQALNAVWTGSDTDAWAVGDGGTVVRYDGEFWFRHPVDTDVDLHAIWGFAADDIWAAGDDGTVMHFDGTDWVVDRAPTGLPLRGIWGLSSRDLFVVGVGEIFHYNGKSWSRVHSSGITTYVGVWGTSPGDVWVLGDRGDARRYDGRRWISVPIRAASDDEARAHDTASIWGATPNDVWAIGRARPAGGSAPTTPTVEMPSILRFDGHGWHVEATLGENQQLNALWGSGRDDVWAVGNDGLLLRLSER